MTTSLRPSTNHHTRRRRFARWVKRSVAAAAGLGIVGAIVIAWLPSPVAVDVAVVRRGVLEVEIDEEGQTRVLDRFVVSAPIGGDLGRIELEPGIEVQAGDPLARIAPPHPILLDARARSEATAQLAAATARRRRADTAIERARAARDVAIRDADRTRTLVARGVVTISEREHTELAEELAIRDVAAAELERVVAAAEVEAARAMLDDGGKPSRRELVVTAPVAGHVLRVVRDSAGPILAGAPVIELGDPRALEVVVDVLSSDATQIAPGMPVSFEGWGGEPPLLGKVRRVEPSAFTRISALGVEEQRVKVIASLDHSPPGLGDGFRVDARIITWRGTNVLGVPASAVFRDHERWAVYVSAGQRAELRPVVLGHRGQLDVEVVSGVREGDRVVLHPGDRVTAGVRVTEN